MSAAFRCETCDAAPMWRIMREGDAAISWACSEHLSSVCDGLQRDWEITQLAVVHQQKLRETVEIGRALDDIAEAAE